MLGIDAHLWRRLYTLYKLAEMGACRRTVKVSTGYLAERMGVSQQTASRQLIQLERMGWIQREVTPEGSFVRISDSGMRELSRLYLSLRAIMEARHPLSITLEGTVFTGLGEGAYYVSKDGYRRQFIERLGFDPYPGTLNIKLATDYDIQARMELENYPAIEIQGFRDERRTYGPVRCYPAVINNQVRGAVVFARRSHYDLSVIEIVAPVNLRSKLKLRDGSRVRVEVFTLP